MALIICIGTAIDFMVHQMSPYFSVPNSYFPHKIFYGTLWAFIGYLIFRKKIKTSFWLAFTIAAVPATLLQTMYFIQGHQLPSVVLLFLFLHFLMFFLPGYYMCKKYHTIIF